MSGEVLLHAGEVHLSLFWRAKWVCAAVVAITSSGREAPRASAAGVRRRRPLKILDKFIPKIACTSNLVLMHTFLRPIWDISKNTIFIEKYENKLTSLHDQIKKHRVILDSTGVWRCSLRPPGVRFPAMPCCRPGPWTALPGCLVVLRCAPDRLVGEASYGV